MIVGVGVCVAVTDGVATVVDVVVFGVAVHAATMPATA